MTIEEIDELVEKTPALATEKHTIRKGLQIFEKYTNRDIITFYTYDKMLVTNREVIEIMSVPDVKRLAQLGWFIDEDRERWGHY